MRVATTLTGVAAFAAAVGPALPARATGADRPEARPEPKTVNLQTAANRARNEWVQGQTALSAADRLGS